MNPDGNGPLTVVVRQIVKLGSESAFEATMRAFIAESSTFPGSEDFHVVRPSRAGSREYTVIHRFANEGSRRSFVDAPTYPEWMKRLRDLTEIAPRMQEQGGIAGWFTLPDEPSAKPPSKLKMALVTFVGVYPLTSVLPGFFSRLLPGWHPLVVNIVTTGSIVGLLTWLVMPLLTRVAASWLFRDSHSRVEART